MHKQKRARGDVVRPPRGGMKRIAAVLCAAMALGSGARALADDIRPIVVVTSGDAAPWAAEIRQAVAAELHAEALAPGDARQKVARGTLTVSLSTSSEELIVRYQPTQGEEIVRRLRATGEHDRVVKTSALLAGNLVRNEAQEILDAQKPRPPAGPVDAAGNPIAPATGAASGSAASAGTPEGEKKPPEEEPPKPPVVVPPPEKTVTSMTLQPPPPRPCDEIQARAPKHPLVLSLFYPVGSNMGRPNVTTPFAQNFLYGRVGQIQGLDLGTVGAVKCDVHGAQIQVGVAYAGGNVHGVQIGGIVAWADETVTGVQIANGLAMAHRIEGTQIAGFNMAREVRGAQIGLGSYANDIVGPQIGMLNLAGNIEGPQIGILNIGGEVHGPQIGILNIGRHVRGPQIGVLNLSREASGSNIGISISKSGYIRPVVWASTSTFRNANVGLRFDMRWLYAQLSIGYVDGSGFNDWAFSSAFGLHVLVPDEPGFLFDLELGSQSMLNPPDQANDKQRGMFHAIAGWRVSKRLAFFGGMGIVYSQRDNDNFIGPDVMGGALF